MPGLSGDTVRELRISEQARVQDWPLWCLVSNLSTAMPASAVSRLHLGHVPHQHISTHPPCRIHCQEARDERQPGLVQSDCA